MNHSSWLCSRWAAEKGDDDNVFKGAGYRSMITCPECLRVMAAIDWRLPPFDAILIRLGRGAWHREILGRESDGPNED